MIGKHGGGGGGRGRGGRGGWGGRGGGRTLVLGNWPTYRRFWPGYAYPGYAYPGYYQALLAQQQAAALAAALAAAQQVDYDTTDNEVREAYINWRRAIQSGADSATIAMLEQQLNMLVFGAQQPVQAVQPSVYGYGFAG